MPRRRPADLIQDEIKYGADQKQWFVEIPNSSNTGTMDATTAEAIERLKQEGFTVSTKQTDTKSPYAGERYVTQVNIQRPKVISNSPSAVFSASLAPQYDPVANAASKVKTAIRSDPGSARWEVALDAKNNPQEKDIKSIKDALISEGFDVEYVPQVQSGYNEITPATLKIHRKDAAPINMALAAGVPLKKETEYASLLKAGPSEKTAAKVKEAIRSDPSNSAWKVELNFDQYTSQRDIGAFIESIKDEGFDVSYVGERSHRNETIGPEITIHRGQAKPGKLPGREFCTLLAPTSSVPKESKKASPSGSKDSPEDKSFKKSKPTSKLAEGAAKSETIKESNTAQIAKDSKFSKSSSETPAILDSSPRFNTSEASIETATEPSKISSETSTPPERATVSSATQVSAESERAAVSIPSQTSTESEPATVSSASQTPTASEPSPVSSASQAPAALEPLAASDVPEVPPLVEISTTSNLSEIPLEPMDYMTEPLINIPPPASLTSANQFRSDEPAFPMMPFATEPPQMVSTSFQSVDLTSELVAAGNRASKIGKKPTREGNSLLDSLRAELIDKLCEAIKEFGENQDIDKFVKACTSIAHHEVIFQHHARLLSTGSNSNSNVSNELEKLKSTVDKFLEAYTPNYTPPFNTSEKASPVKEQQQSKKSEETADDDSPPLLRR